MLIETSEINYLSLDKKISYVPLTYILGYKCNRQFMQSHLVLLVSCYISALPLG